MVVPYSSRRRKTIMQIVTWAAIAPTLLMGLANLGHVTQETTVSVQILGLALVVVLGAVYTPVAHSTVTA